MKEILKNLEEELESSKKLHKIIELKEKNSLSIDQIIL
jgi:hypothetical protein